MADDLLSQIRLNGAVPRHVAVIMDGNGRWARERSLPRPLGHRAGMKAVREAVEGALEAGVEVLTLFAFSEENWQRPVTEISALMQLLEEYIAREVAELKRSEEHTSELQSPCNLVCRLLLEKKKEIANGRNALYGHLRTTFFSRTSAMSPDLESVKIVENTQDDFRPLRLSNNVEDWITKKE